MFGFSLPRQNSQYLRQLPLMIPRMANALRAKRSLRIKGSVKGKRKCHRQRLMAPKPTPFLPRDLQKRKKIGQNARRQVDQSK